jgi:NAD-dependent deacetylase sirtuin 2
MEVRRFYSEFADRNGTYYIRGVSAFIRSFTHSLTFSPPTVEDQCTELPREKVVNVHGSMDRAECAMCKTESDFGEFAGKVQRQIKDLSSRDPTAPASSTPITCELCGAQSMKPAIVLFKSSLPVEFFEKVPEDIEAVDLLIVIGTSLRVAPANSLVWRVPKSTMRLLVNREEVGWHLGMNFGENANRDYFAEGSCENVLLDLMEHLGWLEDLAPLASGDKLPESSADLLRERLSNADLANGNGSE